MMKMSGRVMIGCVALLLALPSVSAVQRLNSISDLRQIDFGRSVSRHSLLLLYWFANAIGIDGQNNMWLTFDPNTDYGSHHYCNAEELLEPPPRGHRYFTVGALNRDTSEQLPDYVVNPGTEYDGRNRDRIVIRVNEPYRGWRRIDRVYLTQHEGALDSQYDPYHTYEVTTNLLREIRQLGLRSLEDLADHFGGSVNELNDIRSRGGELASLGLLLFIVLQIRNYSPPSNYRNQSAVRSNTQSDFCDNVFYWCCSFFAILLALLFFIGFLASLPPR